MPSHSRSFLVSWLTDTTSQPPDGWACIRIRGVGKPRLFRPEEGEASVSVRLVDEMAEHLDAPESAAEVRLEWLDGSGGNLPGGRSLPRAKPAPVDEPRRPQLIDIPAPAPAPSPLAQAANTSLAAHRTGEDMPVVAMSLALCERAFAAVERANADARQREERVYALMERTLDTLRVSNREMAAAVNEAGTTLRQSRSSLEGMAEGMVSVAMEATERAAQATANMRIAEAHGPAEVSKVDEMVKVSGELRGIIADIRGSEKATPLLKGAALAYRAGDAAPLVKALKEAPAAERAKLATILKAALPELCAPEQRPQVEALMASLAA